MKPTQKHTPTPWKVNENNYGMGMIEAVINDRKQLVARCYKVRPASVGETAKEIEANAGHIVKCVNLHDELIQRFESLVEEQENYLRRVTDQEDPDYYSKRRELEKDRKLLKRAKGEL
jgi:hypothetical protein